MQLNLPISIDQASWANLGRVVPRELLPLGQVHDFHVLTTMLRLGTLTTPVRARGLSLNSFWAYIRYFGAFSPNRSMRIHSDFYNLDPHQKTILSDDFGVAFSMEFLREKLDIRRICDGSYFMQHFAEKRGLAYARDPSTHGPQKCPDYICLSNDGKIHLVECKGTQSGRTALRKQIERGMEQKNSILINGVRAGERLVSGLLIRKDTARLNSELFISDPIEKSPAITISESDYNDAESDLLIGDVARHLATAGFEDTSFFLSSRLDGENLMKNGGAKFTEKLYSSKPYDSDELSERPGETFTVGGESFIGRIQVIDLPSSFTLIGERKNKAVVKAGIKNDLVKSLREQKTRRSKDGWPLFDLERDFQDLPPPKQKEEQSYGEIVDSGIYASTIEFE